MNRRIALVAIAAVLALFGTVAVYSYAHQADQRAVAGSKAARVLIALKQVPAGTNWSDVVKGGYLQEENVPASAAPETALSSTATAGVGATQVAASDIAPGQIVLRQMFGEQQAVTGVLAIPKGKLAITVTMQSDADVAGFVVPQSNVAIFVTGSLTATAGSNTAKANSYGSNSTVTRMLLPRVQVIATSQAAPTDLSGSKSGNSSNGTVLVTFALTQQQAEQVILAHTVGQLYLGLLSDSSVTGPDNGTINAGVFNPTPIFLK